MWERGELGVGELTLSERCDWSSIWFTAILETSGSCFLREMRRQVAMVRAQELVQVLASSGEHFVNWSWPREQE